MHALNDLQFLDNQLQSFRWNLGMCIPDTLMSGDELSFLRNQNKIRSLTLVTDFYCDYSMGSVSLVQFPELKSLTWKGLNRYSDLECLKDYIRDHGHQIVSLTLDLVDYYLAAGSWTLTILQSHESLPDNFLFQEVLNANPEDEPVIFPSLEYIDLSAISFANAGIEMPFFHNFESLKTLKLRSCVREIDWLEMVSNSGNRVKLKCFELSRFDSGSTATTETICKFIERASELETLCLVLFEPTDWESIMSAASSCSSLTRLVVHSLAVEDEEDNVHHGVPWPSGWEQLLQGRQMTCFGTSTPPGILASQLQGMQNRPLCKLLHIRATGTMITNLFRDQGMMRGTTYEFDVFNFAKWAFSADGLPNLSVLAWGDFSYEGRYSKFNMLLCRSETGCRPLSPSDVWLWGLVNDNMDMLAACPIEDIVESPEDFDGLENLDDFEHLRDVIDRIDIV
ncbi:hypothetical protein ASPBRDRAFT_113684 [Aspergillus brasiliensis CBS 101740]|uniref:Uncharacterized protein n=1 Tax=Aspergillus brasiliensis (strain CBS 101740 / IMI 381727 / IBT 21946) TaxID=767769 RepID=A0A1L9V1T8_ASPBC|nr:hypothetical protein ASPBRDRAFT_113684 [Aspergillus brasiliensis CBS 101740]